jgi:hypothetical protein
MRAWADGGEGGIRTLGALTRTPDFESGTIDHSATSPVMRAAGLAAKGADITDLVMLKQPLSFFAIAVHIGVATVRELS